MDIGSIFLILGLLVLVGLYISRPFIVRSARGVSAEEQKLSAALAEQERLLNTLNELDFDYSLGKVPEADYPVQRAKLVSQAAEAMRQVDMLTTSEAGEIPDRIETAIAARRAEMEAPPARKNKRTVATGAAPDDELEALIASRRRERLEKAAGFCPQCGKPVQISDKFCPRCGALLLAEEGQKA